MKFEVMWMLMLFRQTAQESMHLQRGTYSKIKLCKNSIPNYELPARSPIECFSLCKILLLSSCVSVKYQWNLKLCSLYENVIRFDFDESANRSCSGYQIKPDCPNGFRYLIEGNKCVQMKVGTWNWSEARTQCNNVHPRSHPIVVDDSIDLMLFSSYCKNEILPKCSNPLNAAIHAFWTAGISPYVEGLRQPFQWQTFPNVSKVLKSTTPWNKGQPNSVTNGILNCIIGYFELALDDYFCNLSVCALCEIDMPMK